MKTFLKWLFFLLIGLILALILLPFVFEDEIKAGIKQALNDQLNAEANFSDISVSMFRQFPLLTANVKDLSIVGIDEFDGVPLLEIENSQLGFSLLPLFDKSVPPSIQYIGLKSGKLNVLTNKDGKSNLDILKTSSDTSSTSFDIEVQQYEITNFDIYYKDDLGLLSSKIDGFNHSGKGDFTQDQFVLQTNSSASALSVIQDGFKYIDKKPISANADIKVDVTSSTYTIDQGTFRLQDLVMNLDGLLSLVDEDMYIEGSASSANTSFGSLASALPYLPYLSDNITSGTFDLKLITKGTYNGEKQIYPTFNVNASIKNGGIQYPDLPSSIKNINANIEINSSTNNLSKISIKVPAFDLMVDEDPIKGNLIIDKSIKDANINGKFSGALNLKNITKSIPLEGIKNLKGNLDFDVEFASFLSDIEAENYDKITCSGNVVGKNLIIDQTSNPSIQILEGKLAFSPQQLDFNIDQIKAGRSMLSSKGSVKNPLAYFLNQSSLTTNIKIIAEVLDANEWMTTSSIEPSTDTLTTLTDYNNYNIAIDATAKTLIYEELTLKNTTLNANYKNDILDLKAFNTNIGESDITLSGSIKGVSEYMNDTGVLSGNLMLNSDFFNADYFMADSEEPTEASEVFRVPENLDFNIKTDIKKLAYTNLNLESFKGEMEVKEETVNLKGLKSRTLGGTISLDGLYDSKETMPEFDVKLDLSQMAFQKAFSELTSLEKLAPIAKYIEGIFNTTLVFQGKMTEGMLPDFSTLNASGYIETINSTIKGAPPLAKVGDQLNIRALQNVSIENTKNWFDIVNGTVELKERQFSMGTIPSTIRGFHKIDGGMNYEIDMSIPRKSFHSTKAGAAVDSGLNLIIKEASKLGFDISNDENINIRVVLTGRLNNPYIKIIPLGSSGGTIKSEVETGIEQVKDSIRKEVNKKTKEVKDSLKEIANKEFDKAKEVVKTKAEEQVDIAKEKAKEEVRKVVDSTLVNAMGDSIAQKAKDVINSSSNKTVKDIKDKIENWNPFGKKKKKNN